MPEAAWKASTASTFFYRERKRKLMRDTAALSAMVIKRKAKIQNKEKTYKKSGVVSDDSSGLSFFRHLQVYSDGRISHRLAGLSALSGHI